MSSADPVPISTHVLDTVTGTPAAGIPVRLLRRRGDRWQPVGEGVTDDDGRVREFSSCRSAGDETSDRATAPQGSTLAGTVAPTAHYRLVFDLTGYFGSAAFYEEVVVSFVVRAAYRHHHVPVLLSAYGYTTYRGS